jgi:hypothetical protein
VLPKFEVNVIETYRLCTRLQACVYSVFVFRLGYCGLVFMIWNFVFGVGNSVFLFKLGYYVIIFILMYSAVVFKTFEVKEYGKTIIYYILLLKPVVHFSIKGNIEHLNVVKSMYLGKCLTVIAMTDFNETQPFYGYPAFAYVGSVHEVFLRIAIYIFSAQFSFWQYCGLFPL